MIITIFNKNQNKGHFILYNYQKEKKLTLNLTEKKLSLQFSLNFSFKMGLAEKKFS